MSYPREPPFHPSPSPGSPYDGKTYPVQPRQNYRFSPEEMRVLKECNRESFYQRCLPFMSVFGGATYYAVKMGYLKGNAKWGAAPKVTAAVIVGFVAGKISYKSKCEEKIMQLPGGRLKESLMGKFSGMRQYDDAFGEPAHGAADSLYRPPQPHGYGSQYPVYSDEPKSIAELDTDRPLELFDDSFRNADASINQLPAVPPTRSYTYDELRAQNRMKYEESKLRQYRGPTYPDNGPIARNLPGSNFQESPYGGYQEGPRTGYQEGPATQFEPIRQPAYQQQETYSYKSASEPPVYGQSPPPVKRPSNQYGDIWDR